jgi:formylglycine-generating enzyme required for sulfatase activity
MTVIDQVTDDAAAPEARLESLVQQFLFDSAGASQAAERELAELERDAVRVLLKAMTDARLTLEQRVRAGTLAGRIGDPRFEGPFGLGPLLQVPAGPFSMGSRPGEPEADTNAVPLHEVNVPVFWMAKSPVTNQQFAVFMEEAGGYTTHEYWLDDGWRWLQQSGHTAPHYWRSAASIPNHPVVGVSWFEAQAYCEWLTRELRALGQLEEAQVIRLPTEAEWEKAARGGLTLDDRNTRANSMPTRRYPWGDSYVPELCNTAASDIGSTNPVGMFPDGESPYRIEGLSGNTVEWCISQPKSYPYNADDGRNRLRAGTQVYRIVRGGAWPFNRNAAACAYRHWFHPDFRGNMLGFRYVRAAPLQDW